MEPLVAVMQTPADRESPEVENDPSDNISEEVIERIKLKTIKSLVLSIQASADKLKYSRPSTHEIESSSERVVAPLVVAIQASADTIGKEAVIFNADFGEDKDLVYATWRDVIPRSDWKKFYCACCRGFWERYGGLHTAGDDGSLRPMFWSSNIAEVPPYYRKSVGDIVKLFEGKGVGEEFRITSEEGRTLGKQVGGDWPHLSVELTEVPLAKVVDPLASQDVETSYIMLRQILEQNSAETIVRAHHLLHSGQLPHTDSHRPAISWLMEVSKNITEKKVKGIGRRKNLITRYARKAFPGCISSLRGGVLGYSSLRGGVLGYFLDNVRAGKNFGSLYQSWTTLAGPTNYLRPMAESTPANIETAEKIFAKLGYNPYDLSRVFLTLDQVPTSGILWSPKPAHAGSTGASRHTPGPIFGKLLKPKEASWDVSIVDVSFRKFAEEILPGISPMELDVKSKECMYFLTTGKEYSKPLMSFSTPTNTASRYVWAAADSPTNCNIKVDWTPVVSIITFPHMWDEISPLDAFSNEKIEQFVHQRHGIRFMFCLEGAKERGDRSLALFPTFMRSEFHGVRKTVEAFSKEGVIERVGQGKECVGGVVVSRGKAVREGGILLRVRMSTGMCAKYRIVLFD